MKRMPYIIISVTGILLMTAIFAGCSFVPIKIESKEITGVSLYQGHMNYAQCYSFYLRKEDDKVFFDAQVSVEKENEKLYTLVLESCEVDSKYFDELNNFVINEKIAEYVNSYKKKPTLFDAMDKTSNTTTLYFADGTDKSADSGSYKEDLCKFFTDLALEYQEWSVSVNQ